MKFKALFGTIVILGWVWLSIIISENFFSHDGFAEIAVLICCASVGIFLSFSTEYFVAKVRLRTKAPDEKSHK